MLQCVTGFAASQTCDLSICDTLPPESLIRSLNEKCSEREYKNPAKNRPG